MSNSNFPTSLDTTADLPDGTNPTDTLAAPNHATLHNVVSDAVIAVETKLGTGSSTATANLPLVGTGSGATAFEVLPAAGGGTGITSLGSGVATFLQTPSSANLAAAVTDETGSGALVFGTSPSLTTPTLAGATITDATNIVVGSTTGTIIGTATSQKLGFYNATPVVQQLATADLGTALSNLGLRAAGTAYPISTSGAVNFSGTWTNNTVPANALATSAIYLGYTAITSNFSTASTSAVQVTGLTVTVTIPAGGRKTKITVFAGQVTSSGGAAVCTISIWDGTVGSGTQLGASVLQNNGTQQGSSQTLIAIVSPAAGSKIYNVGLTAAAQTAVLDCSATAPSFILVEAI